MEGIFKGLLQQDVSLEILNKCNKALYPDSIDYQIYPQLFRYLFYDEIQGLVGIDSDFMIM